MPTLIAQALRGVAGSHDVTATEFVTRALTPNGTVPLVIDNELIEYSNRQIRVLTMVLLGSYGAMSVLCGVLIAHLRHHRLAARGGDPTAAQKILLPSFEPLLWLLLVATGFFALFLFVSELVGYHITSIYSVHTESVNAGREFVVMFVAVFMLQQSVSLPALARTSVVCVLLSSFSILVVYLTVSEDPSDYARSYWAITIAHGLLTLLYVYISIRPPSRASAQTLREYCAFGIVSHVLDFVYLTAFYNWQIHLGFTLAYANVAWGSLCPLVVWRVLRADTEHWRGLGQRACALQLLFARSHMHEHVSSQGLHVLIELHKRYVIDFAYLQLHERIGVGSTATVFRGMLKSREQVAVKVYTPLSVTEDTVAEFSHEAALCSALIHPNVVAFVGICVSPPTICLLSELCVGSLDVILRSSAKSRVSSSHSGNPQNPNRQQILVNLGYMLDAARAVAYLHSFSPPLVHRDIKPGNYLVDERGTVKLTDFGDSRSLPKCDGPWEVKVNGSNFDLSKDDTSEEVPEMVSVNVGNDDEPDADYEQRASLAYVPSAIPAASRARSSLGRQMTVKGTVDYMAPEIINGKAGVASYGEPADVYALAITMWDILNPGIEKYPDSNNNYLRIFDSVVAGTRPHLDYRHMHPRLRLLMEYSWHDDPESRPTAQEIVSTLEQLQEEMGVQFAFQVRDELEQDGPCVREETMLVKTYSGLTMVKKMVDMGATSSSGESVRLGNLLMNAGFLHHVKHARSFADTTTTYFFDVGEFELNNQQEALRTDRNVHNDDEDEEDELPIYEIPTLRSSSATSILLQSPYRNRNVIRRMRSRNGGKSDSSTVPPNDSYWDLAASASSLTSRNSSYRATVGRQCACQKLGSLDGGRKSKRHGRRRGRRRYRTKYRVIPEEATAIASIGLTTNLLLDDSQDYGEQSVRADYIAYHSPVSNTRARPSSL